MKKTKVSYLDFWLFIASQLGTARLHLYAEATSFSQLFIQPSDPQHHLRRAIEQSYHASGCRSFRSPVDLFTALDALGEAAYQLRGNQADDLLDIELLEEIAWLITTHFGYLLTLPEHEHGQQNRSQVVSLANVRISRANSRG